MSQSNSKVEFILSALVLAVGIAAAGTLLAARFINRKLH